MKELTDREFLFRLHGNEGPSETWPEGRLCIAAPMKSWGRTDNSILGEDQPLFGPNVYGWAIQHLRSTEEVCILAKHQEDILRLERHGSDDAPQITGHVEDRDALWILSPGKIAEFRRPAGLKRLSLDAVRLPKRPYGPIPAVFDARLHVQTYCPKTLDKRWEGFSQEEDSTLPPTCVGLPTVYGYALWHLNRHLSQRFDSYRLQAGEMNESYAAAYLAELDKLEIYRTTSQPGFLRNYNYWLTCVLQRPMFSGPDFSPGTLPRSISDLPIFHREGHKPVMVGDRVWQMWRKMLDLPLEFESPCKKAEAYAEFIVEGRKLFTEDLGYVIKT